MLAWNHQLDMQRKRADAVYHPDYVDTGEPSASPLEGLRRYKLIVKRQQDEYRKEAKERAKVRQRKKLAKVRQEAKKLAEVGNE